MLSVFANAQGRCAIRNKTWFICPVYGDAHVLADNLLEDDRNYSGLEHKTLFCTEQTANHDVLLYAFGILNPSGSWEGFVIVFVDIVACPS